MGRQRMAIVAAGVSTLALGLGAGGAAATGNDDEALFGALSGRNELGPEGQRGVGDRDGRGSATAVLKEGELCYALIVRGIDAPVAAHIHRGTRRENGPIVIPLTAPEGGDPGTVSGCVEVERGLARELTRQPRRFYWNVHTREFPGGAVRGQVFAR